MPPHRRAIASPVPVPAAALLTLQCPSPLAGGSEACSPASPGCRPLHLASGLLHVQPVDPLRQQ